MKLSDFPRPPDDNGRGVHWSARIYHPSGPDLDFWIAELQAMHIKWVKLLDDGDGSSLELCRRLLDAGIMPVVRLFRERPNPGHIGGREISGLRKLTAVGVRYFETNNEPDLPAEWQEGKKPANWLDIVVDNFIYDADIVLKEGGFLAVPAMGPGGKENVIQKIVDKGRRDLFEKGCWVAIHNYTLNHPLDYPDDSVNQEGTPLTQEEYDRFGAWAWDNRSIEQINEQRARDKNPGQTVFDDPNCFRAYEVAGKMIHDVLGFYVPVISTEGGPVVGWGDDTRYPKVIPDQQAEWQLAIVKFLQSEAPEWYFTCCTWLLASRPLGDWNPTWDQMSWYTDAWNERFGLAGRLPVVQALKDFPSQVRPELRRGTASLGGILRRADTGAPLANVEMEIEELGGAAPSPRIQVTTDEQGRFLAEQLHAGRCRIFVSNVVVQEVTLLPAATVEVNLEVQAGQRSAIFGVVTDDEGTPQPGLAVSLHEVAPPLLVAATETDSTGAYRFEGLGPGEWLLRVAAGTEQASERPGVITDGWSDRQVNVTVPPPPGFVYRVAEKRLVPPEETGNANLIFGQVLDGAGEPINGVTMRLRWTGAAPDVQFPTVKTGRDQSKPPGYYEFFHTPGVFMVDVVDPERESEVADNLITADMPGRSRPISYEVNFRLTPKQQREKGSSIVGRIPGGREGLAVTLIGGSQPQLTRLGADKSFRFDKLAPGAYQISVAGVGVLPEEIILDGTNTVTTEFAMLGQIVGKVLPTEKPASVVLTCERFSIRRETTVSKDGVYRFANLPADTYSLTVKDSQLPPQTVVCDGKSLTSGPVFDLLQGRHSMIFGRLLDHQGSGLTDRPIELMGPVQQRLRTENNGAFRFTYLPAGDYTVRVVTNPTVWATATLDGKDSVEINLRLPASKPEAIFEHYLLLIPTSPKLTAARLLLATDYILRTHATVGFDPSVSTRADRVTIIGSPPPEILQALQEADVPFNQVADDLFKLQDSLETLL